MELEERTQNLKPERILSHEDGRKFWKNKRQATLLILCECCNGLNCCFCGVELVREDLEPTPDPFSAEVHEDYTQHIICEECQARSALEV